MLDFRLLVLGINEFREKRGHMSCDLTGKRWNR